MSAPHAWHPQRATTRTRKHTSHGLHLFLSIITWGMWALLVWLPLSFWHRYGPRRHEVTRYR